MRIETQSAFGEYVVIFFLHAEVVIIDRSLYFHPVTKDNEGSPSGTIQISFLFSSPEQQPTIFIDVNLKKKGSSVSSHAAKCLFYRNVIVAG